MVIEERARMRRGRLATLVALCCGLAACTATSESDVQPGFAGGDYGFIVPAFGDAGAEADGLLAMSPNDADAAAGGTPVPMPRPDTDRQASEVATADSAAPGIAEAKADDVADPDETDAAPASEDDGDETGDNRRNFLSAFFSSEPAEESPAEQAIAEQEIGEEEQEAVEDEPQGASGTSADAPEPEASTGPRTASIYGGDALPGVRESSSLFEITRKSGVDDNSDIDLYESPGSYQVASAAGMARLAPNGLLKQRDSVDVSCFKSGLMNVLKSVERRYGKRVLVTSGYRSPSHNRRVRGARKSLHMQCAAADIQVAGVSKWELARYVREMPGRGGVGTYCHTNSIHVDVGPERDWNWRCKRGR